jgi:hypothetical protein
VWAGGTFFPVVLLCFVNIWFWWEQGFDLHTHVLLRVQYSCGGVLVIWFWWEIDFGIEFECNEFLLVSVIIDLIYLKHSICISST